MLKAKMGGQPVLRVLLKGDDDLADSLLGPGGGGREPARGLREVVTERYGGAFAVELDREPGARSDLLLQQAEGAAAPASWRGDGMGEWARAALAPPPTQFLNRPRDVVVLSLQPDLVRTLWRHRESGYLVDPPPGLPEAWGDAQKQWFSGQFAPTGLLPVAEFKENFSRLIRVVKERLGAHVLVFNCSTLDPDDDTCNYHGREDTLALRTHRFNLALMEISMEEGISIIDVERLISEMGGGQHVIGILRYSGAACEEIYQECLRVLADIAFFESRPLIMQVGRRAK